MSVRAAKRAKRLGEEMHAGLIEELESTALPFEVDRIGSRSKRRKLESSMNIQKLSASSDIVSSRTKAELAVLKRIQKKLELSKREETPENQLSDIWDDEPVAIPQDSKLKKSSLSRTSEGLSYNPSFDKHQEALAEALALEIRHREKLHRESSALQNHQLNVVSNSNEYGDDSDSEVEDDQDQPESAATVRRLSRRKSERFTKAKRNKIRARNISNHENAKAKEEQELLDSIDKASVIVKELEEDEQRRQAEAELKQLAKSAEETGMNYEEAGLIPLSDELRGSLRKLVPKGVAIKSVECSMRDAGKLMSRTRRARRMGETPYASKRVKWVAKYKYP